jgi:hypothetical protein
LTDFAPADAGADMHHASLSDLLGRQSASLAKGPLAVMMAEDDVEIESSLAHLRKVGFQTIVLLAPPDLTLPADLPPGSYLVTHPVHAEAALPAAVNAMMDALDGIWIHACYNAEYLHYPFCETRSVRELVTFHSEERRQAMMTYVIDLYAGDLGAHPDGVSLEDAWLDQSGYYALARKDASRNWAPQDRQIDCFGGLRWRFEEHVPWDRRRIDRISLFRARKGLRMNPDFTLDDPEMNTYACPWHHNLTAAVCSFRAAKALRSNPGSRSAISTFRWNRSAPFRWHSAQLLELGMIEPGQWF